MGVEVDSSLPGGVVASAKAVSATLEELTNSGTFAGEVVIQFVPEDLLHTGPVDSTY